MTFAAHIRSRSSQRLLALISSAVLMFSVMAVFAPPAQAHNGTVTWGCDGWSVNLNNYNTSKANSVTITVDGNVVDSQSSNWSSYSKSGTWDDTKTHTLVVDVKAWDDATQTSHTLGSNSSFSPDWQHGEWSFKLSITQDACTKPPQDVSTTVVASSCSVDSEGVPGGSVDVTINPASGATVKVYTDSAHTNLIDTFTSTGSIDGLSPGTYYWKAKPADGFELTGPKSGSVVIENCDVTVSVSGVCQAPNGVAVGVITAQISVDDAATVEVSDSTPTVVASFTESGSESVAAPASYTWEATASDGFDLSGPSSGTVDIEDCTPPPEVGAAILVTVAGQCVVTDNLGSGVIDVTVSVAGGATVVVTDSNGVTVGTLTESGTITVPEGDTYSWSATASDGFEFAEGSTTSGTIPIPSCSTVVGASILVTVGGTCVLNGDAGSGVISVTVSVADGATVVVSDSDGGIVGTFSSDGSVTVPEGAVYSWVATPSEGFEFPAGFASSGSITIPTCSTPTVLPFTGVYADQLATLGFILLAAGVLVMTSGWYLLGWREES